MDIIWCLLAEQYAHEWSLENMLICWWPEKPSYKQLMDVLSSDEIMGSVGYRYRSKLITLLYDPTAKLETVNLTYKLRAIKQGVIIPNDI